MAVPNPAGVAQAPPAASPNPINWWDMSDPAQEAFKQSLIHQKQGPTNAFPAQGTWKGGRVLGDGGQGVVVLWPKVNDNQRVVERIVAKEIQLDRATYAHPKWWIGNCPREYLVQILCRPAVVPAGTPQPRSHTVDMLAWHVDQAQCRIRLYSEYCDHGNLEELIYAHVGWESRGRPARRVPGTRKTKLVRQKPIPEAFLWYVFESMAISAVHMQQIPRIPPPHNPSNEVIHQDIKSENVLLAEPSIDYFRHYPTPKLGDFGSARITNVSEAHVCNPDTYRHGTHTEGMDPPELFDRRYVSFTQRQGDSALHLSLGTPFRILAACNVWQIARVILALMRLETIEAVRQIDYYNVAWNEPRVPEVFPRRCGTDEWVPDATSNNRGNYSATLINLVNECLQAKPEHRPSPTQLSQRCAQAITPAFDRQRNRPKRSHYNEWDPNHIRMDVKPYTRKFAMGQRI